MGRPAIELISSLPLETCCRLLDAQIDNLWSLSGSRPLIGRRTGTWLRVRPRITYRNSFQTHLTATLSVQNAQTLILCRFGMHPFVIAFLAVWFTFVVFFGGLAAIAVLFSFVTDPQHTPRQDWMGVVVPTAMMAGGVAMVRIGRYMARDERDNMLAFVCTTLQAKPRV